jgi:hypothetical protein
MNPNRIFGNDDAQVNGDILTYVREGELYELDTRLAVLCAHNTPMADNPGNFEHVAMGRNSATAFLALNTFHINSVDANIQLPEAANLAYLRFLAIKYKLMSARYQHNNYACDYNQAVIGYCNDGVTPLTTNHILANDNEGFPAAAQGGIQGVLEGELTVDRRAQLNKMFTNIVCLVAYMFRTRGHHYLPDMQDKYVRLWNKTATRNIPLHMSWENIATIGLHAIMPMILDMFYTHCRDHAKIDSILVLRYDSAAAGTALFPVLKQGLSDILVVVPKMKDILVREIEYIDEVCEDLKDNRWRHSINARFYNERRDRLDEKRTGATAALIRACIDTLAADSDIIDSKALLRASKIAPITGAAFGRAIRNYVNSDKFLALGAGDEVK